MACVRLSFDIASIRQVALFSVFGRRQISKSTHCYFSRPALLTTWVRSGRNEEAANSNTISLTKRHLHKYQIVFNEVQPDHLIPTRINPDEEMSTSSEKDRRSSPVPKAGSPGGPIRHRKPSGGIISPPLRKGMFELDRAAFDKDIKIPVVYVYEDSFNVQNIQAFKRFLLKIPGLKPIQEVNSNSTEESNDASPGSGSVRKMKKILINPEFVKGSDLTYFLQHEIQPDPSIVSSIRYETVKFKYENWTFSQIFNSVLPDEDDKVSGFSQVGHIIHLNLRDHVLPYKKLIGQVFLDKVANAKTVVNKVNIIDSKYRNFQMEILGGDPNTVVTVKENRCEFQFDFATVYWNPRLSGEHDRLVKTMEPGDVLYDVFAGVGPFTIPAAKRKINILANDLNPDSFKWLQHNVKKNKVTSFVECFNLDGRAFIQDVAAQDLEKRLTSSSKDGQAGDGAPAVSASGGRYHFVMNLPALAVDFLDAFWGILSNLNDSSLLEKVSVLVHVYCFIKDVDGFKEKAVNLVNERLGYDLSSTNLVQAFIVRNVAPNKEMLRVSFTLPGEVMMGKGKAIKRKFCEIEESNENK